MTPTLRHKLITYHFMKVVEGKDVEFRIKRIAELRKMKCQNEKELQQN